MQNVLRSLCASQVDAEIMVWCQAGKIDPVLSEPACKGVRVIETSRPRLPGPAAESAMRLAQVRSMLKHRIDVLFGSLSRLPWSPVPWIGWIPDFQHLRLPHLFSRKELDRRERIFRRRGSGDFSKPTLGGLIGRYALLLFVLVLVIGPFIWQLSTSFKGPQENIYSFPPNLIPTDPTLQNYATVADVVPVYLYAWHSLLVSVGTVLSNVILATFAGYALGCMRFRGKWIVLAIFFARR